MINQSNSVLSKLFIMINQSKHFVTVKTLIVLIIACVGIPNTDGQFMIDPQEFPSTPYPGSFYKWDPQVDNLTTPSALLSASWSSALGGRYRREAVERVADICGVSHVCNVTALRSGDFEDKMGCGPCDYCRCDDVCVTYGDCCLDKVFDDVIGDLTIGDTPLLTEEASLSSCFDMKVRDYRRSVSLKNQRLISACPRDYTQNDDVIEKCAKGAATFYETGSKVRVEDMWNIWPVMSNKTSVSYRNRACAECHNRDGNNDRDFAYWNIQVSCPGEAMMASGLTRTQTLEWVLDRYDCVISFRVPQGATDRGCKHVSREQHLPALNVCNATSSRTVYDPVLWQLCRSAPSTMKRDDDRPFYANVFCLLCQHDFAWKWQSKCQYGRHFTFFFMISPSAIQKVVSEENAPLPCRCRDDEALDPVSNTCRKLLCPQGYDLSLDKDGHFRCVDDGTLAMGLSYSLNIELTSINSSLAYDDVRSLDAFLNISKEIRKALIKRLESEVSEFYTTVDQFTTILYPSGCHSNPGAVTIALSVKLCLGQELSISETAPKLVALLNSVWNIHVAETDLNATLVSKIMPPPDQSLVDFAMDGRNVVKKFPIRGCDQLFRILDLKNGRGSFTQTYTEVKNTMTCPHFILDGDFKDYFITDRNTTNVNVFGDDLSLQYNTTTTGDNSHLNISLKNFHVSSSATSGTITGGQTTIVCADEIMEYWQEVVDKNMEKKQQNNKDRGNFGKGLEVTSIICLSVSYLCLIATLITYVLFSSLRTLPGKNTMALISNMLASMGACLATPFFDTWTVACQVVGVANHFFLLCTVTWMVICTYRVYKIFTSIFDHSHGQDNGSGSNKSSRCFLKYLIVSVTVPFIIIAITIVCNYCISESDDDNNNQNPTTISSSPQNISNTTGIPSSTPGIIKDDTATTTASNNFNSNDNNDNEPITTQHSVSCDQNKDFSLTPIGYGEGVCYLSNELSVLLAAAVPILLAVLTNCVLFCLTLRSLRGLTSDQQAVGKDPREQIFIYIKLCALTGLNWLPGLMSVFIDSPVLWYAFLILAGLQGLYVFVAFVLNARVMNMYKAKFCGPRSRPKAKLEVHTKATSLTTIDSIAHSSKSQNCSKNDDDMIHHSAT